MATISAHNNSTIGDMVVEAVEEVRAEGAITVEGSKTTETVPEIVEGRLQPSPVPYSVRFSQRLQEDLDRIGKELDHGT